MLRYLQTGILLHFITICSVLLAYLLGAKLIEIINSGGTKMQMLLFGFFTGYFFSLIIFSQLDARSRYQNYKMVKDKLFEYGFDIRLLKPFVYSRCQRDAIKVATVELNFYAEWKKMIHSLGFRWYHILPHFVVKNPLILFTKEYWDKTLFVKTYQSKYYLW